MKRGFRVVRKPGRVIHPFSGSHSNCEIRNGEIRNDNYEIGQDCFSVCLTS